MTATAVYGLNHTYMLVNDVQCHVPTETNKENMKTDNMANVEQGSDENAAACDSRMTPNL
eukprot:3161660-Karenia_brevis.AAC.1